MIVGAVVQLVGRAQDRRIVRAPSRGVRPDGDARDLFVGEPSRLPITTCWPHSYGEWQRHPTRRIASSRSRPGSVDFVSTWFANTSHRFMSFGCCAIVLKTFRTAASSPRSVDSALEELAGLRVGVGERDRLDARSHRDSLR